MVKDVYNFRSRNYLLRKLENYDRKERVDVDSYTIEHVMPQNPDLSPEWQEELGPEWKTVQERYLHTIGNLTLTGYNSELSDRPFSEKLTMKGGFRDSPLRLNHYLAKLEHWNEEEIQKRAELLADLALKIWPAPQAARGDAGEVPEDEGQGRRPSTRSTTTPALAGPIRAALRRAAPARPEPRRRRPRGGAQAVHRLQAGDATSSRSSRWPASSSSTSTSPSTSSTTRTTSARDVTAVGHWGTGSVEVRLQTTDQLEDVMALVRQSFEQQGEEGYEEPQWSQAGVERVVEEASRPGGAGGAARR